MPGLRGRGMAAASGDGGLATALERDAEVGAARILAVVPAVPSEGFNCATAVAAARAARTSQRLLGVGSALGRRRRGVELGRLGRRLRRAADQPQRARLQVDRVVVVAAAVEHVADPQQHLDLPLRVGGAAG